MSDNSKRPHARRRVRTGCRTCRSRRRKCDEERPVCNNCKTKNLTCQYGPRFTFVEPKGHEHGSVLDVPQSQARTQTTFQSQVESESADYAINSSITQARASSPAGPPDHVDEQPDNGGNFLVQDVPNTRSVPQTQSLGAVPSPHNSRYPGSANHFSSDIGDPQVNALHSNPESSEEALGHVNTDASLLLSLCAASAQPFSASDTNFRPVEIDTDREQNELDLFRHYRYAIAPLLDLGVQPLFHGVHVLLKAELSIEIHAAVLEIAWHHKNNTEGVPYHFPSSDLSHQNANPIAARENAYTARILKLWARFLSQPPQSWSQVMRDSNLLSISWLPLDEQRLSLSRLAVAASLTETSGPPLYVVGLCREASNTSRLPPDIESCTCQGQLQHLLTLLHKILRLIALKNSDDNVESGMPLVSTWQECWQDLQIWFRKRREEMQEIFDASKLSLSHKYRSDTPDYPVIVFGNGCALVANTAYHLTAMLLLEHKPRFIKPSLERNAPASRIWHLQRIIGISVNALDWQIWDPVVVAALLCVAPSVSHDGQMSVLVKSLRRIAAISGMRLDEEIRKIDRFFNSSRA